MLPSGILMLHRSFLKWFPLFIWLLFAISSVSNFRPDTGGGGGLLLRFAGSVQSCCGEGRALQEDVAVCGEHSPCPAALGLPHTGVSVLSPSTLLRLPAALYGAGPALSAVPVFRSKSADSVAPACCVFPASAVQAAKDLPALSLGATRLFPLRRAAWAARGLGALSPGAARLFPPR